MSRHVADRHDGESTKRAERYAEIERKTAPEGSHPAAKELHKRAKDRGENARVKEYTRIERGHEA